MFEDDVSVLSDFAEGIRLAARDFVVDSRVIHAV